MIKRPDATWGPDDERRTRLLLECAAENSPSIVAWMLERAGYDVVVCDGPDGGRRCPTVATGAACPAVESADVVVNFLGRSAPERAEVLPAVAELCGGRTPIVALVDAPDAAPTGVRSVSRRVTETRLLDVVAEAVAQKE